MRRNNVKLGKTRNPLTNRPIVIFGKTHKRVLEQLYSGNRLKKEIRNFKNKEKLIRGNLNVFPQIIKNRMNIAHGRACSPSGGTP